MFTFLTQNLQRKWNEICKKQVASGKCMENNCFLKTLKFEMIRCTDKLQLANIAILDLTRDVLEGTCNGCTQLLHKYWVLQGASISLLLVP